MCPPPLQIAGKACNSMYLSHFHRLRQWIQKRVQIIKLSQKVNTKFQKIYRSALVPQVCKGFLYHSLAGPARRPMGSRCSRPALRAPLGIRAYGQQSRRTGNGVSKVLPTLVNTSFLHFLGLLALPTVVVGGAPPYIPLNAMNLPLVDGVHMKI